MKANESFNRPSTLQVNWAMCILFSLFSGLGSHSAWSQPTLVDPTDMVEGSLSDPAMEVIQVHWDVTNLTTDTLYLMVTRTLIQTVDPYNLPFVEGAPGAYDRFCWGPLCYDYCSSSSGTQGNLLVILLPNEVNNTFASHYHPNEVAGVTAMEYCFHPIDDVGAGACHTILFCMDAENCAVGLAENELELELGSVNPQPVQGLSSFSYHFGEGQSGQVRVLNAAGQEVLQSVLNNPDGVFYLNGDDFPEGLYILSLESEFGSQQARRFIVKH